MTGILRCMQPMQVCTMQVLGERELLRNEVLAELSKAADAQNGPKFLHIVVKLSDVESVYFNTSSGQELRAGQDSARPRSALTAALANSPKKSVDVENSRYSRSDLCKLSDNASFVCLSALLKVCSRMLENSPYRRCCKMGSDGFCTCPELEDRVAVSCSYT